MGFWAKVRDGFAYGLGGGLGARIGWGIGEWLATWTRRIVTLVVIGSSPALLHWCGWSPFPTEQVATTKVQSHQQQQREEKQK